MSYRIQDSEAGNIIETGLTLRQAKARLQKFESDDKASGTYTHDFYEIRFVSLLDEVAKALKYLSVADVASRAGVTRQAINTWLNGKTDPRLSKIEAVLRAIEEIKEEMPL